MAIFLSTYENKIDKKGRVSVPAQFRNSLAGEHFAGIVAYKSFINNAIESCSMSRIEQISESIDILDPFSEQRDAFATAILGGSVQLAFDADGRIKLPESLIADIRLEEKAIFVGKGKTFEIWNPADFQDYQAQARELAKQNRAQLSLAGKRDV